MSMLRLNQTIQTRRVQPAFTLAEILVVLIIMVLLLAAAIPAFRALTGGRSVDAAQNVIGAMLGRARTMAMNDQSHPVGVFFYMDPATDRTVMRLVQMSSELDDPDPYDQYKAWVPSVTYRASDGTVSPPIQADRVVFMTRDTDVRNTDGTMGKLLAKIYRCIQTHTASTGNSPPPSGPPFANAFWEEFHEGNLSLVPNVEAQVLPVGIGVQLINDPRVSNPTMPNKDRYVRTGVILFDSLGRLAYQQYSVNAYDPLGKLLRLDTTGDNLGDLSGTANKIYSGFGVVIYELEAFRSQSGNSDGDISIGPSNKPFPPGITRPASAADEVNEEKWLDDNTTPLLVSRYTGTLGGAQ